MQYPLKKQWNNLEKKRVDLMLLLSKYDVSTLNKKPSPEAWSANQVLIHLMQAEAMSLSYMRKKLSFDGVRVPRAGIKSRLRRFGLRVLFALPFKFKAPANLDNLPENSDFNVLKTQWASQRLDLETFIESLPDNLIHSELWKHQIAGKMSIAQMVDFFEDHFDRHQKQIEQTLIKVSQ
jgi:hypothetical protein